MFGRTFINRNQDMTNRNFVPGYEVGLWAVNLKYRRGRRSVPLRRLGPRHPRLFWSGTPAGVDDGGGVRSRGY
jgi:hypothetical protein